MLGHVSHYALVTKNLSFLTVTHTCREQCVENCSVSLAELQGEILYGAGLFYGLLERFSMRRVGVGLHGAELLEFVSLKTEEMAEGLVHIYEFSIACGDVYSVP